MPRIKFQVPCEGQSISCEMTLGPKGVVRRVIAVAPQAEANSPVCRVAEVAHLVTRLLRHNLPWEALAQFRNGTNLVAALIEAGDECRTEFLASKREASC